MAMPTQLLIIMGFQRAGEALVSGCGLSFPGPLCRSHRKCVYDFVSIERAGFWTGVRWEDGDDLASSAM
jgi:hypothetical protein